jgi:hypothetical protein
MFAISEEGDNVNNTENNDTVTPDPVRTQIPSHPGSKYHVRGTPHFDLKV